MKAAQPCRTVAELLDALGRGHVLTPAATSEVAASWRSEASDPADLARFTRWLVSRGTATEYQLALVLHGHSDRLVLGPYRLLDRRARGRLAVVFKALDPQGQTVALKVLPPSRARDAQTLARFQRESQLACRLVHPNVVRAFGAGVDGAVHYLVLEYLEGETLEEMLARQRRLAPAEAVALGCQVLAGLQYLLEQGLVHRNLEPANLLLSPGGASAVKILDISLGRSILDEVPPGTLQPPRLTFEGQLLGVPDYLAPEQAQDAHTSDIRADIYSIGCILYHALAGAPPFSDPSPLGTILRHASESPRPIPEVPPPLWRAMERMLAKDPRARFATPREAARELAASLAVPPAEPERPVTVPVILDPVPEPLEPVPAAAFAFPVAARESPPTPLSARRRDYFLLLVGAVGVLLAQFLGWLAAQLLVALGNAPK